MLFIPGLISSEKVWQHQFNGLKNFIDPVVVCVEKSTPEEMVDEILNRAPEKFILCGHSMGGWLCLEFMRHFHARVLAIALVNTTAKEDSLEKLQKRNQMIEMVGRGDFVTVVDQLVDRFVFESSQKPNIRKMFLDKGPEVFINHQHSMIQRSEVLSILPKISVPTLIIHALKDQNFQLSEQIQMKKLIKTSKLAQIEDAGHMSPMESPQAVTALLRFWLEYDVMV